MAFNLVEAVKDKQVKVEDVIAATGGKAPRLCAASGRVLRQPWITYSLDGTHYLRVMARFQEQWDWSEAQQKKILALVSQPAPKADKKVEVKS